MDFLALPNKNFPRGFAQYPATKTLTWQENSSGFKPINTAWLRIFLHSGDELQFDRSMTWDDFRPFCPGFPCIPG